MISRSGPIRGWSAFGRDELVQDVAGHELGVPVVLLPGEAGDGDVHDVVLAELDDRTLVGEVAECPALRDHERAVERGDLDEVLRVEAVVAVVLVSPEQPGRTLSRAEHGTHLAGSVVAEDSLGLFATPGVAEVTDLARVVVGLPGQHLLVAAANHPDEDDTTARVVHLERATALLVADRLAQQSARPNRNVTKPPRKVVARGVGVEVEFGHFDDRCGH